MIGQAGQFLQLLSNLDASAEVDPASTKTTNAVDDAVGYVGSELAKMSEVLAEAGEHPLIFKALDEMAQIFEARPTHIRYYIRISAVNSLSTPSSAAVC